jgi:hypothetical protein
MQTVSAIPKWEASPISVRHVHTDILRMRRYRLSIRESRAKPWPQHKDLISKHADDFSCHSWPGFSHGLNCRVRKTRFQYGACFEVQSGPLASEAAAECPVAGEETMHVIELIKNNASEIVTEAASAIERAHVPHLGFAGTGQARQRLQILCDLTLECLQTQGTAPMSRYAEKIACERFFSGYTLREVQTAFNLLEESIWSQILDKLQVNALATAVTMVNAPLRAGKDEVARTYFSLPSKTKVSSSDL